MTMDEFSVNSTYSVYWYILFLIQKVGIHEINKARKIHGESAFSGVTSQHVSSELIILNKR